jgi:hypothetical protein
MSGWFLCKQSGIKDLQELVVVNSPLPISLIPDTKEETATKEVLCNV